MRAFTLLELMVVVVIVGVLSAAAAPSIVDMMKKAEGEQAVVESASALAAARDGARSQAQCLDYALSPGTPNSGPYRMQVFEVACPGDAPRAQRLVFERAASPTITSLSVRTAAGERITAIHFDRNGALYNPVAELRVDAVVNGTARSYAIYPAAGTISFTELK